ncbi:putative F-box/LRR-repeat protein 23 [Nicotiana sylvestris]|uniref:putative F-box/LRR-repeat protein 23 n=1 Tax=Nicotiana sylvestris TaxID=4096 RepID=UPI00388CC568
MALIRLTAGLGNIYGKPRFPIRSNKLRHLRLVTCYYTEDGCLAAAAKNFPLLEELHIYLSDMNKDDIEVIALAVARNMPKLRHLSLLGNVLTNEGLYAILDGCLHLQSLDIRHCFNINLEGDLGGRCKQQIIDLKLPHDSTYGYEFDAQPWPSGL